MFSKVKEDGCHVGRRPAPRRSGASIALGVAVLAVFAGSAERAMAQQGAQAVEFRASVVDLTGRVDRIAVPLYGSVSVETTAPITRADVVAKQIADVQVISPTRLLVTGQAYGTTNVVLLGEDKAQHVLRVSVELDLSRLNEAIREIDPLASATAQSVLGNIVLSGTVSSAERASRITGLAELFLPKTGSRQQTTVQNHLDIAGVQQVLLRVVVAEVNRTAARALGVNGFLAGENFRDAFIVSQVGGVNPINIGAAADSLVTQNIPFLTGQNGIPLVPGAELSLGFPRVQLQTFIKALVDNTLLKILAEPNLVAISGETAQFLVGGEFPYPVSQGLNQVTAEFKEFGIQLNFTPVVRGPGRIRLRVNPVVTQLDFSVSAIIGGFPVPGLRSRSSETTVELASGQMIAIAGLLSEEVSARAQNIPGIGEVPILGALFRSVEYKRSMTELVILVMPEIVAPIDAHQKVVLPTDGSRDPSDYELYALGLLEGATEDGLAAGYGEAGNGSEVVESEPDEMSVHGPWGHARSAGTR